MTTARKAAFNAASQRRVENAAQQSALGEALSLAGDWATQAVAMQQSLLAGLVRSQDLEARRLAALYAQDDDRVAAARARSERYADMRGEILERADQVGRVVDTFQSDGKFTGYVLQTDGEPAPGYVVQLAVAGDVTAARKGLRGGKSTTDATGWFSIDLEVPSTTTTDTGATGTIVDKPIELHVQRMVERLMDTPPEAAHQVSGTVPPQPAPPAPGQGPSPSPSPSPGVTSRVAVFDPTGREVYDDPMPPTFADTTSEFRVYTLFNENGLKRAQVKPRAARKS